MDTHFLETFAVVCRTGSFAAAARRLGLTPAAVALRVRALEQDLAVTLVHRAGRSVRPTEAGRAVAVRADDLLGQVRRLRSTALGDILRGELRVAAISTVLTGLIPDVMKRMMQRHQDVTLHLTPATSAEAFALLERDEIDAAFLVQPPFTLTKHLEWLELRAEPLVLIAPPDETSDDPLALLGSRPFLRYDRRNWGGLLVDEYLRRADIAPSERLELDSLEALTIMVSRGLGISIVPEWSAPWPAGTTVRRLDLNGDVPRRRIGLLWKAASPRRSLIAELVQNREGNAWPAGWTTDSRR